MLGHCAAFMKEKILIQEAYVGGNKLCGVCWVGSVGGVHMTLCLLYSALAWWLGQFMLSQLVISFI